MYRVDIITDQTDHNGDDVVHSIHTDREQVDNLSIALNSGVDYVSITDARGGLNYVRKMDIHAVSVKRVR